MPTEVVKTIKPAGGGDYTSLEAWNTAEATDLTSSDEIAIAECYGGGNLLSSPGSDFRISGFRTDSTRFVKIIAADGEGHQGSWDTGKAYALNTSTAGSYNRPFWFSDDMTISNIQFKSVHKNASFGVVWPQAMSNKFEIDGCYIEHAQASAGSYNTWGLRIQTPMAVKVTNNIIVCKSAQTTKYGLGYTVYSQQYGGGTPPTHEVYNNTLIHIGKNAQFYGIRSSWGNITSENNYVRGDDVNTFYFGYGAGSTSPVVSTGAGDTPYTETAYSSSTFTNVTVGSEDFTLPAGSALIDAGETISSVTSDAIGTTRPYNSVYDVGAIEYFVAAADPILFTGSNLGRAITDSEVFIGTIKSRKRLTGISILGMPSTNAGCLDPASILTNVKTPLFSIVETIGTSTTLPVTSFSDAIPIEFFEGLSYRTYNSDSAKDGQYRYSISLQHTDDYRPYGEEVDFDDFDDLTWSENWVADTGDIDKFNITGGIQFFDITDNHIRLSDLSDGPYLIRAKLVIETGQTTTGEHAIITDFYSTAHSAFTDSNPYYQTFKTSGIAPRYVRTNYRTDRRE